MNNTFEFIVRNLLIGVGATMTMDVWALVLKRFGIPSLNFALLGRFIGHLPTGRWFHVSIAKSPPIRGELLLGWCAHYAIGIGFATQMLLLFGLDWARSPRFLPALAFGIATVVAPLLVLQPALEAGIASSKTPTPVFNSVKSLVTHIVFGTGLFVAAKITAHLINAD